MRYLLTLAAMFLSLPAFVLAGPNPSGDSGGTDTESAERTETFAEVVEGLELVDELGGPETEDRRKEGPNFGMVLKRDFGIYTFTTPKPDWKDLTKAERIMTGAYSSPEFGPLGSVEGIALRAVSFACRTGRAPQSLPELFGEEYEAISQRLPDLSPRERLKQHGTHLDPIEGDLIKINPEEVEPGAVYMRKVDSPDLKKEVLKPFARSNIRAEQGGPVNESDFEGLEDADAAVLWYRVHGKDGRVIKEAAIPYWPSHLRESLRAVGKKESEINLPEGCK